MTLPIINDLEYWEFSQQNVENVVTICKDQDEGETMPQHKCPKRAMYWSLKEEWKKTAHAKKEVVKYIKVVQNNCQFPFIKLAKNNQQLRKNSMF